MAKTVRTLSSVLAETTPEAEHQVPQRQAHRARPQRGRVRTVETPTGPPLPRTRPHPGTSKRTTVDLPPEQNAGLTRWCLDVQDQVGGDRLHGQHVMRALVYRLLSDDALARQIVEDLRID